MGAEAREPSVRGLAGILAVLVGIMLILNQEFLETMDDFLRKPLIPVSQTTSAACAKVQVNVFGGDCETVKSEADLLSAAAAISQKPDLLLRDAVPNPAREDYALAKLPLEGEVLVPPLTPDHVQPEAEGGNSLLTEEAVPSAVMPSLKEFSDIVPEPLPDTSVIVAEIVSKLPAAAEVEPERPSDIRIPIDTAEEDATKRTPMETVEDTEKRPPADFIEDIKITDPIEKPEEDTKKPSEIVSEQKPDPTVPVEDMTPPAPKEPDTVVPEKPADEPVAPEPIVPEPEAPGTEIPDSGAEEIPGDLVEGDGTQTAPSAGFLLDEAGMMCGFQPEYAEIIDGCLELPAECTGIRSGAFLGSGAGIVEMYIPAGVAVIEEGAFAGLDNLEWIEVEGGNAGYASVSGVLFDSSMSVLMKFPSGRVDVYSVPSQVTAVAGRAFEGTALNRLDLRRSAFVSFEGNVFGDSAGNGLVIAVPEEQYEVYAQMLSGYSVILTK